MNDVIPTLNSSVVSAQSLPKISNLFTTKQIAEQLGTSPKVILANAKKCLPQKVFENGKTTFFTEEEITLIIEQLKLSNPNQNTFTGAVKAVSTQLTPALKIKKAMELMQEGYEEELAKLRAKNIEMQPKADVYDRIANADSLKSVDQVASNLGFGTRNFFALMRGMGIFFYSSKDSNGERVNLPKQEYKDRGYFVTKEEPYKRGDENCLYTKIYITGKGEAWLAQKVFAETAEKILEKSIFYDVAKEAKESEETIYNFCNLSGLVNTDKKFTAEAIMAGYADENGFTESGRNYILEKFKMINIAEKTMRPTEFGKAE